MRILTDIGDAFLSKEFLTSISFILVTVIIVAILSKISWKYREKIDPEEVKVRAFVRRVFNVIKGFVIMICIFAVLQANGINITSMVTGVGLVSAIAGLAMQDLFKDIIMGLHIISDHSFEIGDVIEIGDDRGVVVALTLTTTQIESTKTGYLVTYCNRNITQVAKVRGVYDIDLPLSQDLHPDHVRDVFEGMASEIRKLPGMEKAYYLGIQGYQNGSVVYRVRFHCSPSKQWPMWRKAITIAQKHLIENDIRVPYTQYDVHMKEAE